VRERGTNLAGFLRKLRDSNDISVHARRASVYVQERNAFCTVSRTYKRTIAHWGGEKESENVIENMSLKVMK
jgi:hypothetical protein